MARPKKPARLYQRKDENVWIIIDQGRHIRTGCRFEHREEAEKVLAEYLASKASETLPEQHTDKTKVGIVLATYLKDSAPTQKSIDRTIYAIEALSRFWSEYPVSHVTSKLAREYARIRPVSDSTIRRELGVLQAALNHGHSEMGLPQPTKLWKPTESPPLDRWLSEEEIAALLEVSPEHLRRFILISVFTGRRKGAVLGLRWEHGPSNGSIDFETNRVQFIGDAENETSKRKGTILMPEQLRQHLLGWKEDGFASVVHYEGKPVKDIDTSFATACKKANISGVKPHVLKHTAVTHAFRKGMTLTDAVEFFATSSQTLEPTYRHHSPLYQENAAGLMTFDNPSFVANKVAAQ